MARSDVHTGRGRSRPRLVSSRRRASTPTPSPRRPACPAACTSASAPCRARLLRCAVGVPVRRTGQLFVTTPQLASTCDGTSALQELAGAQELVALLGQFRRNTKTRGVYKLGSEGFVYLFRLFSKVSTAECVSKAGLINCPPPTRRGTHARHQMALSAADHKRLVRMREIEHAQTRKKERAKGRRGASTERTIVRTPAKLSNSEPAVSWQGGRAAAAAQRMTRQAEAAPLMMPSNRTMVIALVRARNQAGRSHD